MVSRTLKIAGIIVRHYSIVFAIVAAFAVFSILNPRFARLYNVLTVLQHASLLAVIATGLTLVLILDEFDLSFATLSSAAVCVSVNLVQTSLPGFVAVAAALGLGLFVGLVNGFLVAKLEMRSFIATLGTGTILTGFNYSVSGGETIVVVGGLPDWFNFLGQETFFGVSYLVPVMLIVVALATILVRYTALGRNMYGVGGNKEACLVAGVNVPAVQIAGFALGGLAAGLTGFLLASRLGGGHPLAGEKFLLQGFAAAFIGMTMRGGIANVIGTFLGAIFLAEIESGLTLVDVDYRYQYVVNGLIIVVFVCIAYVARNRLLDRVGARLAVAKL